MLLLALFAMRVELFGDAAASSAARYVTHRRL
jgi:hypothetical protein